MVRSTAEDIVALALLETIGSNEMAFRGFVWTLIRSLCPLESFTACFGGLFPRWLPVTLGYSA